MKKPPKVIKLVLKAVCILLQVQPIRKKADDGIHFKESYWAAAQSKEVLGNVRLPDMLIEYDRNKISQPMMISIEEVLKDPDYTYENAYRASKAATGMFKWVKAIREYYYIFQEIEPRRDAFMLSEKQYSLKVEELQQKRKELGALESHLISLQEILDEKDQIIEDLKIQIQDCKVKKKRADVLLRGLSSEKQKWIVCTRMLAGKYLTVTGDVLLSSAFISLLSGFTQKYRNKLIKKWKKLLQDQGLPVSDSFNFNDLFGDPMKIRDWQINGLPQDHLSINNAIIMEKSKKYCICIDPQYQACNWLKNQHYDNGLIITKYGDNYFRKSLEIAIELGKPVLVENIGDKIDLILHSLLEKDIIKHGSQRLIKFCRKTFKFDKNFDLFLITNVKNPHFNVDITNLTTMVNFYVTFDGLQQQLLSLVVANERSDLEERFSENTKEAFENIRGLKEIENAILEQLQMDVTKLLGDELLIKTLNESRNTAELIAMKLKAINQTSQFMQKSRDVYSPVSKRASLLYFVVADLSKINNMYQFSLSWFINVFKRAISMTNHLKVENKNLRSKMRNSQLSMKTSLAFTSKGNSIDDRIELLIKTFTQELYKKICSSIYEKDRMLVTYLMVLRVLEYEDYLDRTLYTFLLIGPKNPDYSEEPTELKLNWINKKNWGDLKALSQIKPFTISNLLQYIKEFPTVWNEYYKRAKFSYDDLPNKDRLNLAPLLPPPIDDRFEIPLPDQSSMKFLHSGDKSDTEDDQNRPLTRNVSSVLNDEELWRVSSESDEEEQQVNKFTYKKQNLGGNLDEDDNEFLNQEEEMAQYLLENNPAIFNQQYDVDGKKVDSVKMTKQESDMRAKKELVLKQLIELCILKCIRPDKINESIDKFLQVVINPSYTSFSQDIAAQYTNQSSKRDITNASQKNVNASAAKSGKANSGPQKVSNFIGLLKDAYDESNRSTPIFFLITHSVNVFNTLGELQKSYPEYHQIKLQYLSLGKGLERRVEEKIIKASQAGDWLLLENLHLVTEWLSKLEEIIMKLEKADVNPRFRLWLSSVSVPNFPNNILQMSIKVSLQPPSGIKYIMDRLMGPNDEAFKKSKGNAILHKNLHFYLIYFHSVLVGRKKYGTLGWNVPYEFDFSDFEISSSQLLQMMRRNVIDDQTNLKMMKYLIGEINYSNKIWRNEDKIILNAIMDDLFNPDLAFIKEAVPQNVNRCHYGVPILEYNADNTYGDFSDFMRSLPEFDKEEIFGFNDNIQRLNQRNIIFDILRKVNQFNTKQEPFNNPLDISVKDQSDMDVKELSQQLLLSLPQLFAEDMIKQKYPLSYDIPLSAFINREVFKYNNLLSVIKNSLIDLVNLIDGKLPSKPELDILWQDILNGIVPKSWLIASYPTCSSSISDFIKNLQERMDFVRSWLDKGLIKERESIDFEGFNNSNNAMTSFWFPGFFDQSAFLTALKQKKARQEHLELEDVDIRFDVMRFMDPKNHSIDNDDVSFITGFWLEGCLWDMKLQILIETDSQELYVPFPAIKLTTLRKSPIQRMNASTQKIIDCEFYTCPVFKTTMRLANNVFSVENEALMHIPLKTKENVNKWIKRGVALILNPSNY